MRTRPLRTGYLVVGLAYLGAAAVWAAHAAGLVRPDQIPLLLPALLVLAGVAGLVAGLSGRREPGEEDHR